MALAYYRGEFLPYEEVRIPLSDRSVYFGDGVYDAAVGRGKTVYQKEKHLSRFLCNLGRVGIRLPFSEAELSALLGEAVERAGLNDGFFLYFQGTRTSERRLHASDDGDGNLLITVSPLELPEPKPLDLITYEDRRYGYCHIKTLNLLPSVLAARAASDAGADEAVFLRSGVVTECSHSNISILKDRRLITHPADCRILKGIGRENLIEACREVGIGVSERAFTPEELVGADEVLITSTSKLCLPARALNGKAIGGGDPEGKDLLCERLRSDFLRATGG